MVKKILYIVSSAIVALAMTGCSDWLSPEPMFKDPENIHGEDYYEALRAYKASDHVRSFGWYSSWTALGNDMKNYLIGLPDSMDFVSHWLPVESYVQPLSDAQKKDLKAVQKKGTKVLFCLFFKELGFRFTPGIDRSLPTGNPTPEEIQLMKDTWGWYEDQYDGSDEANEAIRKYARAMTEYVIENGYDGIDFDYEAHWGLSNGNIGLYPGAIHVLLDELSKNFGPKSGTGRLLVVDGEPQSLLAESGPLIDYYIIQAYNCSGDADLDNRFAGYGPNGTPALLDKFKTVESEETVLRKTIWTENFEAHQDGQYQFTFRGGHKNPGMTENEDGELVPRTFTPYSMEGMARYYRDIDGKTVNVGGFGAFRFDISGARDEYLLMRRTIQVVNPSK